MLYILPFQSQSHAMPEGAIAPVNFSSPHPRPQDPYATVHPRWHLEYPRPLDGLRLAEDGTDSFVEACEPRVQRNQVELSTCSLLTLSPDVCGARLAFCRPSVLHRIEADTAGPVDPR